MTYQYSTQLETGTIVKIKYDKIFEWTIEQTGVEGKLANVQF